MKKKNEKYLNNIVVNYGKKQGFISPKSKTLGKNTTLYCKKINFKIIVNFKDPL